MTRWIPARWLSDDERGLRAGERPPFGLLDGRWYCDTHWSMGATLSEDESQRLLDAHLEAEHS